ncbi:MAG: hypothetical protein ACJ73C_08290 [Nitrososphaeraceae archaeon]
MNCNLVIPLSPNWWIVHEKKNTDIAVRVVQESKKRQYKKQNSDCSNICKKQEDNKVDWKS